jgi:hypothetical protein
VVLARRHHARDALTKAPDPGEGGAAPPPTRRHAWLYGEGARPTMLAGIAVIAVGVTILAASQDQH